MASGRAQRVEARPELLRGVRSVEVEVDHGRAVMALHTVQTSSPPLGTRYGYGNPAWIYEISIAIYLNRWTRDGFVCRTCARLSHFLPKLGLTLAVL